jgi:hypothetical protein
VSLAEAFAANGAPAAGRCAVADLLLNLDPDDAAALRAVLEPRVRGTATIRAILQANGHSIGHGHIEAHKAAVAKARGITSTTLPCSCVIG